MALSDYMPDFSDPYQMALFGSLGAMLNQAGQQKVGIKGAGIGTTLAPLFGQGIVGGVAGAQGAQQFKASDQQNQLNNFNLMYYRKANGLDPFTGQPAQQQDNLQQPPMSQGAPVTPVTSASLGAGTSFGGVPQMNASQLSQPPQGGIPNPPTPSQIGQQPLPPAMGKAAPMFGSMGGASLPSFAAAPAMAAAVGPYLQLQQKQIESGMRMNPDGSVGVIPGAVDAQASLAGAKSEAEQGAVRQTNAQRIALENASSKNVENYKNYLEYGDNGLGGPGSIINANSPAGANKGQPIISPHGTVIPDVTEQTPIPKDAKSLDSAIPAWQKTSTQWTDSLQAAQQASVRLNVIANSLKIFQSNATATAKATAVSTLQSIGVPIPASTINDATEVEKITHANVVSTLKNLATANPRFAQSEFKVLSKNSESPDLLPGANLELLSDDIGSINQQMAMVQDWRSAQKIGWRNPQDFEAAWMAKNPQQRFVDGAKAKIGLLAGMSDGQ